MDFDVDPHIIFLGLSGSHAYGTARAGSDVDVRGCCIAPLDLRLSFRRQFEQVTWPRDVPLGPRCREAMTRAAEHPSAGPSLAEQPDVPDLVIFDLAKLVGLCARQNPNTLELLFVDPREILFTTPTWERLRAERHAFLSQKVRHTFSGYARGQLERIRGHRQWLLSPPEHAPTRAAFGLPEQSVLSADERNQIEEAITKVLRSWSVDEGIELPAAERDVLRERMREFWTACMQHLASDKLGSGELDLALADRAGASLGLGSAVLQTLRQERRYRAARQHWEQFVRWQRERNPARAALEARHGYDTKHGMHLIRLLRMGVEILATGDLVVRREDAGELLAIRDGALDYDALIEQAEQLELAMREALKTTPLPAEVDEPALDRLLVELLTSA
ncbi:DNA polymerase beta superfamily protein [Nannocystaceae bacterium ST9]